MNPGELIYFSMIGFVLLITMVIIWFVFRKKKRFAMTVIGVLMVGYIGYYFYFPTLKINTHEKGYAQMTAYLSENYPGKDYEISPKHYEEGNHVGEFYVNEVGSEMGATFQVDKEGEVTEKGTWSNLGYPPSQQELWRDLVFYEYEGLETDIPEIIKKDEWFEGELAAFGLINNGDPAIALFHYSREAYGLIEFKKAEDDGVVTVETEEYIFVYVNEDYGEDLVTVILSSGEELVLDVAGEKGRLIVRLVE